MSLNDLRIIKINATDTLRVHATILRTLQSKK